MGGDEKICNIVEASTLSTERRIKREGRIIDKKCSLQSKNLMPYAYQEFKVPDSPAAVTKI